MSSLGNRPSAPPEMWVRTMMKHAIGFGLVTMFTAEAAAQCPMTIPELVKAAASDPIERYRIRDIFPIPLAEIAAKADLIVEGHVRKLATYLSDDQCILYTDYAVLPQAVIAGQVPTAKSPGQAPIVVRMFGGETSIDGVKVIARDEQLLPFTDGQHLVLFLTRVPNTAKYEVTLGLFGAVEVSGDRMKRLLRAEGIPDEVSGREKTAFIEAVKRLKEKSL